MTSANSSFPRRLTSIDELTRTDHTYLTSDDVCEYLGEYSARQGFAHSATNNLIMNLKKPMRLRGTPQWRWKERAIEEAGDALRNALDGTNLQGITFVPIPPSKAKTDPAYDDRMSRVLARLNPGLDVRELVTLKASMVAVHEHGERLRPDHLVQYLEIDEAICDPRPSRIVICDDVLTTGCHYRAVRSVLSRHFPGARFLGIFLARRVPQPPEFEPVDTEI
jgi:hypothetical protein